MKAILIKNGTIVDGSGSTPYKADIVVRDGVIQDIAESISADNANINDFDIIDAEGLMVSPGFIDIHTHHDLLIMEQPHRRNALSQGVTTEIVGLCGLGVVPLCDKLLNDTMRLYSGILGHYSGDKKNLACFSSYLTALNGSAINVAAAVTHGAVRAAVMGYENRVATDAEKSAMAKLVAECLDAGAVAFSTGLTYLPSGFADSSEIIEICRVVKEKNKIFLPHKRDNYAKPRNTGDAEIVDIVKQTNVRLHLLHYRTGLDNAGEIQQLLAPYNELIAGGYDISFEFYPYAVGAGFGKVFLPPWVTEGGIDSAMARLADRNIREQIKADMQPRYSYLMPHTGAIFTVLKNTKEYEGLHFAEVAMQRGQDELSMILDLLLINDFEFGYYYDLAEDVDCTAVEDDFFTLLDLPFYTVGSDAISYGRYPHPRASGSFTRLLRLARERGYPIEKLIHKITGYPAKRFGLKNKGQILAGMDADIAIFDYGKISDRATFKEPTKLSDGVVHLLVNGDYTIFNGNFTDNFYGKTIRG